MTLARLGPQVPAMLTQVRAQVAAMLMRVRPQALVTLVLVGLLQIGHGPVDWGPLNYIVYKPWELTFHIILIHNTDSPWQRTIIGTRISIDKQDGG